MAPSQELRGSALRPARHDLPEAIVHPLADHPSPAAQLHVRRELGGLEFSSLSPRRAAHLVTELVSDPSASDSAPRVQGRDANGSVMLTFVRDTGGTWQAVGPDGVSRVPLAEVADVMTRCQVQSELLPADFVTVAYRFAHGDGGTIGPRQPPFLASSGTSKITKGPVYRGIDRADILDRQSRLVAKLELSDWPVHQLLLTRPKGSLTHVEALALEDLALIEGMLATNGNDATLARFRAMVLGALERAT